MREIHVAKAEADALAAAGFGKAGMKPAEAATRLDVLKEITAHRVVRKKRLFWYRVVAWIVLILASGYVAPRVLDAHWDYAWLVLWIALAAAYYIGKTDD